MIKFDIKHKTTGEVKFTANIDCSEYESNSIKLGLAVRWGIKHLADLSSADLRSADLSYADLRYADLRSADLRSADLSSADLRYADLRSADLSSADLSFANLSFANLRYADLRYADNIVIPITINGLGDECRTGYAAWDNKEKEVYVRLGCFWGTEKEALSAINKKYSVKSGYYQTVKGACMIARERKIMNPTEKEND